MFEFFHQFTTVRAFVLSFVALCVCSPTLAEMPAERPALGVWLNQTDGNTIGLELVSEQECNLFIEKLLQPRSSRACKYESGEGRSLVFLVGKDGTCGSEPDFEFSYDPVGPLMRFYIGASEVLLYQQAN